MRAPASLAPPHPPPLSVPLRIRYHMWVDAGHLCAPGQTPDAAGTSLWRSMMADRFFVTKWVREGAMGAV